MKKIKLYYNIFIFFLIIDLNCIKSKFNNIFDIYCKMNINEFDTIYNIYVIIKLNYFAMILWREIRIIVR